MRVTHDLVVTRYNEDLAWVARYAQRPGWRVFVYLTGRRGGGLPPVCSGSAGGRRRVRCSRIPNAGYEWHGYLRHVIDRYETLAPTTIFLQGDPLTVSPDVHCLLNATRLWAPVQVLSWVQMAKRKMEFFTQCRAANLGGCRVYVEPVTAGMRPMLHGDRWLHRACRMAKRFKGSLFRFLASQLGGDPALANGSAAQHKSLLRATPVPPQLYRAYGAQFAAAAEELRRRPKPFYTRLLHWLVTPHDAMHTAGFLGVWRAYTPKEKAILLELIWMALLGAERHVPPSLCSSCLPAAQTLPVPVDAVGPSCAADYFSGAPRVEACNVSGDGWGGRRPCSGDECGRLSVRCPVTKNDGER